jgi:CheY-like chemotaxis protein
MFPSKVAGVAASQGITLQTASSAAAAVEKAADASLVIVDLTTPRLDLVDLVAQLRSLGAPPKTILAYGPHVQEAQLAAAQEAGCDLVLTRGQFHAHMGELLAKYAKSQ